MNNVKKNFLYNVIYQILSIILPLITVPYTSRVLGASNIGIFSYTYAIVFYFMTIAMLGITNYGSRSIAKSRDNSIELSKTFFSIYSIQILMSLLMLVIYCFYISFGSTYKVISIIQILYLMSSMFDINWFFFGMEEFKLTVLRNASVKIISLILIILLVKTSEDINIYTLIMSGSTLLSQLILLPFLKNRIKFCRISLDDIKVHIKPCIILFFPVIAMSLYKLMDKIMLGYLANVTEVGFYEQAEKIINMPLTIVVALGTVTLPKISNMVANNEYSRINLYIKKSMSFVIFIASPIALGLISIADYLIPIILGDGFNKSIILIQILAFSILFSSIANIIRSEYLIPLEKDKEFIISVFLGALVNLIVNIFLIPKFQSIGACIGTLIAEFFVMFFQIMIVRKSIPIFSYINKAKKFFLNSLIMFLFLKSIELFHISSNILLILEILLGCIVYVLLNYKYILTLIPLNKILNHRKNYIKKGR
ncbi:flippase [[Eubacterium] hominis]|uniref:flippase n=1 Tax=[Eubacterium] hominis TaxID=2764325 RepID=UPI003A4E2667